MRYRVVVMPTPLAQLFAAQSRTTTAISPLAALLPTPERLDSLDAFGQALCTFAYPPSIIGAMEDFGGQGDRQPPWGTPSRSETFFALTPALDLDWILGADDSTLLNAGIPWDGFDFLSCDVDDAGMSPVNGESYNEASISSFNVEGLDESSMFPVNIRGLDEASTLLFNGGGFSPAASSFAPASPRKHSEVVSDFICVVCGEVCHTNYDFGWHSLLRGHATIKCSIRSCEAHYISGYRQTHMRSAHPDTFQCDECEYMSRSRIDLDHHALNTGHAAFACKHDGCEKKYPRLDTYQRHLRSHAEDAKRFPCKYCKKYRGQNGFKRKDHLAQHVRNYHHIVEDDVPGSYSYRRACRHRDCDFGDHSTTSAEKIKHMRTVHDESEYPCPRPGCDRVNGKGYFRKGDLNNHLRKVHATVVQPEVFEH